MKLVITFENGKLELTVDDGQPTLLTTPPPAAVTTTPAPPAIRPAPAKPFEIPQHFKKTTPVTPIPNSVIRKSELPNCGFCRRRGEPCVRHGGTDSQDVNAKRAAKAVTFEDPWNCEMCRNAQDLCQLHQGLTDEGKVPSRYKASN